MSSQEDENQKQEKVIIMTNEVTLAQEPQNTGAIRAFIDTSTEVGQIALYTAINNAEQLNKHLGEPLEVKSVVSQMVAMADENTGEVRDAIRTIFVTSDNKAYSATSDAIASAVNTMFGIFGTPDTWKEPKHIVVNERRSRKGNRYYAMELLPSK